MPATHLEHLLIFGRKLVPGGPEPGHGSMAQTAQDRKHGVEVFAFLALSFGMRRLSVTHNPSMRNNESVGTPQPLSTENTKISYMLHGLNYKWIGLPLNLQALRFLRNAAL